MERRSLCWGWAAALLIGAVGCRGYSYGHLIKNNQPDLVGSHTAGAEVFNPLIDETVAKLLATEVVAAHPPVLGVDGQPLNRSVCFVGVENKSSEELGDFKDQIYQQIDTQINRSHAFQAISRRMVDAALVETRLRPDALLVPDNMRLFTSVLQRDGQPVDFLLYATLTSGTTERNSSTQRDYLLTLELIDTQTGAYTKEQASIRKGYHSSYLGKAWNYNPLKAWK
ncbi:MAG: penicillin-binding protein activator LpoB [Aureliella sp.]